MMPPDKHWLHPFVFLDKIIFFALFSTIRQIRPNVIFNKNKIDHMPDCKDYLPFDPKS